MTCIPLLLRYKARLRETGCALPAALLPYAAAQLLPALLLPAERVRALDIACPAPSSAVDHVSLFLSGAVVRTPLPAARLLEERRSPAEGGRSERAWLCGRAGRRRAACGVPRGLQGARAGVPGPGALCRGGAARGGRAMCVPP